MLEPHAKGQREGIDWELGSWQMQTRRCACHEALVGIQTGREP